MDTKYQHAPVGALLGRYELGDVLGRGGMSEVRDGWDLKLNRPVAIKLLRNDDRPENRERFATEARAAATLTSPHIVVVHDVGEHDGLPFIVMERLPGVTLADHIAKGPLAPNFVRALLDSVLAALATAHDAGIVHRDVKPGNVLFTPTGEAKLADFGIAKTAESVHTMTGEIVGSVAYLSPERLTAKPATPADDLYAVGVVGYEALTGRRPFPQTALGPLAHAILHETPPPLAAVRRDAPPSLAAVIERAMARNPAQKFTRAAEMRAALDSTEPVTAPLRIAKTPTGTAPLPALGPALGTYSFPVPERRSTQPRHFIWAAALIAAFLLAVILIAVVHPFSSPSPAPASTTTSLPPPPPTTAPPTAPVATTSDLPAQPPPPGPPGRHGKKPKGGHGN